MVPGTVEFVDVQGTSRRLKNRRGADTDVVLIPQPSSDPDDPLNWSRFRKEYHFWLLIVWGILVAASVNWSGPVWVPLQEDLNTTLDDMNISAALCFGFLAIGCILLQPTAMKIGRRPVYLIGTFLNLVGCILGGLQTTIVEYYVVNILTGFGAAPVDSLVQISTTDIFFAHQRGTRLAFFALALGTGSYMGPVAAGYITVAQDWTWCFWYLVIFFTALLIIQIFTLEESVYRRQLPSSSNSEVATLDDRPQRDVKDQKSSADDGVSGVETARNRSNTLQTLPGGRKKYWQRMAPIHTLHANPRPWWYLAIFPFRLVTFPAIVWAGFMGGIQIWWLSLLSVTQSEIFSEPPYNFDIADVGDTNIAAFIGGIFGMLWGGPLSDWYVLHRARRNKGIMEPEFRLWLLIVPAVLNSVGLLLYGLGGYNGWHWMVSAGVGTAFIGFGIGAGGAIGLTYAIDCYPHIAAESMVLILFMRNVLGFAFTFAIQPWIDAMGGSNTCVILAVVCLVTTMTFLILVKWGKGFRRKTASTYLRFAKDRNRIAS
ncbi:MFS general substrate transporter [Mollisia scopiformis]|uniref:MFS general substrate transporter n=1 Tax=Mollisia scopiformis TaxID=149040 RepID=A0A194X5R7_MOLSC|nr:MFS general substrate transporter [Mollisia scopiformis]KUJ15419.1 MFS general substrate transporter [Mollisia scopiformis]